MIAPKDSGFAHRANPDGTFDSICCVCFATVATLDTDTDLARVERQHVCDAWKIEWVKRVQSEAGAEPRQKRA